MKRYDYYINNKIVSRSEMMEKLKGYCNKVIDTILCGGDIYADFTEFDEKEFRHHMKSIEQGIEVCFMGGDSFRRKERG